MDAVNKLIKMHAETRFRFSRELDAYELGLDTLLSYADRVNRVRRVYEYAIMFAVMFDMPEKHV